MNKGFLNVLFRGRGGYLLECPRKLGSMVSKWVITYLQKGVYWGYNPLILTFDPNFQRDIQVPLLMEVERVSNLD